MHNFIDEYKELLTQKAKVETELTDINKRIRILDQTASLMDNGTSRVAMLLRMSYEVDLLTGTEREKNISFGEAMSSMEGFSISKGTKAELEKWKNGEITFFDAFTNVLKRYGFLTEEQISFLKENINWEFAYLILEDLIDDGQSGEELLRQFKKRQTMIRPAVEEMLQQAEFAANGGGESYSYDEVNDHLKD